VSAPPLAHRLRGPRESNSDRPPHCPFVSCGKHLICKELETIVTPDITTKSSDEDRSTRYWSRGLKRMRTFACTAWTSMELK
jgi:hypothetical protein